MVHREVLPASLEIHKHLETVTYSQNSKPHYVPQQQALPRWL